MATEAHIGAPAPLCINENSHKILTAHCATPTNRSATDRLSRRSSYGNRCFRLLSSKTISIKFAIITKTDVAINIPFSASV